MQVVLCNRTTTFVIYTDSGLERNLHAYTINGHRLASIQLAARLTTMLIPRDGGFLYTGGDERLVEVRDIQDLTLVHQSETMEATIECMAVSEPDNNHLLVRAVQTRL